MCHHVLNSHDARTRWRDVLDAAGHGQDVVIARYGKAIAVVIPVTDYEALQEELAEMRAARRAQAALEAWSANPGRGRPYAAVRQELAAEKLLDRE